MTPEMRMKELKVARDRYKILFPNLTLGELGAFMDGFSDGWHAALASHAPSADEELPKIVLDSPICDICGHHALDSRFHHAPGSQGNMWASKASEAAAQPTARYCHHCDNWHGVEIEHDH